MGNKCMVCNEPAFAYREEAKGAKTYLCTNHIQEKDIEAGRVMADESRGAEKGSSART